MATGTAAYVLPVEAASSSEAQQFPGFPGVWTPGVPVAVHDLFDADDAEELAARLVDALGLPLVKTTADPTRKPGEPVSGAQVRSEPEGASAAETVEGSPMPGMSREEFEAGLRGQPVSPVLEALAAEHGIEASEQPAAARWPRSHDDIDRIVAIAETRGITVGVDAGDTTVGAKVAKLEAAGVTAETAAAWNQE